MNRKLPHLVVAAALSGTAALGVASDSDFVADEIRGLHSEFINTRQWVDSDIRANLAHRWETIPNRLAERGLGFAESELESLSWIPNADLAVESDSAGRLAGFSAGGTGLLWTGESAAVGFQPWGRWTDGGENDAASFGIFSRRALGDWGVVGGNVFADYAANGEFGDFARWSAGLDFQSALGELRGNYYAGLSSTRERVGLENRVLAYAPSGVDAELRLRWFGGSEWSGFAEYEKWSGQFGDSDLEEVGYGLSFRPAGGGLLAGLQVDAGYQDSEEWNLRFGYFRTLGADDSVRSSGSAFAVRSALIAPVAREREIRVETVTVQEKRISGQARFLSFQNAPRIEDLRPWIATIHSKCSNTTIQDLDPDLGNLGTVIFAAAEDESRFDDLCNAIQMGGNVDYRGVFNASPLHRAVSGMAIDNLRLLIAAGADVNLQNDNRVTPLGRAQVLSERTNDLAELMILQTLAMLLIDSGGKCVRKETTDPLSLCNQSTASLREGWDDYDYGVSDKVVIYTNHTGDVYQFKHPRAEGATISRLVRQHTGFEFLADGRFRKIEGFKLFPTSSDKFITAEMHDSETDTTAHVFLRLKILQAVHPEPVVFSEIPKVAAGYTGTVFLVTIVPEVDGYFLAFEGEAGDDGILINGVHDNTLEIWEGIFHAAIPVLSITSKGGVFQGRHFSHGMHVLLQRPANVFDPPVAKINASITPSDYADVTVGFTITLSVVANVHKQSFSVTPNFTGVIGTLTAEHDGLTFTKKTGTSKVLVSSSGQLRIGQPLDNGNSYTVSVIAKSPEVLGDLIFEVAIAVDCSFRSGNGGYETGAGTHALDPRNFELHASGQGAFPSRFCIALHQGANIHSPNQHQYGIVESIRRGRNNDGRKIRVFDLAILHGMDIHSPTNRDFYNRLELPIHRYASEFDTGLPMVKTMLSMGVSILAIDSYNRAPIYYAAERSGDSLQVFNLILESTKRAVEDNFQPGAFFDKVSTNSDYEAPICPSPLRSSIPACAPRRICPKAKSLSRQIASRNSMRMCRRRALRQATPAEAAATTRIGTRPLLPGALR